MNINRDNYEIYFLDFLEGNLDENSIDQFLDFLENNQDLKKELQLFEHVDLPIESIGFARKELLYRTPETNLTMLEERMTAYLESDLDESKKILFEAELSSNPALQKEYAIYTKTRLQPDARIVFHAKHQLYRKAGITVALTWLSRVAAVLVLFWGISLFFRSENQPIPQVVKNETTQSISPEVPVSAKPALQEQENQQAVQTVPEPKRQAEVKPVEPAKKTKLVPEASQITRNKEAEIQQLKPIFAQLSQPVVQNELAITRVETIPAANPGVEPISLDEFLAMRVKKAGNEGIMSAQRLVRAGLGLASELSGERIGYAEKDGKITSLEFETKLLAFSIPLEKK